jgi:glucose/arabinose dehydrogenase
MVVLSFFIQVIVMSKGVAQISRWGLFSFLYLLSPSLLAQFGSSPLGDGPWPIQTYQTKVSIEVVARGMPNPWSVAFLPDGDMLVTEREGLLRLIHEGKLDPTPVADLKNRVYAVNLLGLMEVLPHPDFANNQLLYLTYQKQVSETPKAAVVVLAQARYENRSLSDFREILVTDSWDGAGAAGARLVFGRDGKLYMGVGATRDDSAQNPGSLRGKILRLNDDGSIPQDNPFIDKEGYRPEIFSLGHRNPSGLAIHPETGELWEAEFGPNGGDEVNIIRAGLNYGWPVVSFGRDYLGPYISEIPYAEGMEGPLSSFIPGVSPSGLAFYTGSDFRAWTTSAFVGALRVGQLPGTGRVVRIFFDENGNERQREDLFLSLGQRIRDIRMGPDGLMYLLTEEQDGALLVIKPDIQASSPAE